MTGAAASANAGQSNQIKADIVIAGGSFSAPASALEAARSNPDAVILLIEPTTWLGGQATSQGVSAIDNAWHDPGASLMRENPATYYPADYLEFIEGLKNAPKDAPGKGFAGEMASWVTREAYDPRTAAWVLDEMIARHPNIKVMKLTVVKNVTSEAVEDAHGKGRIITGLELVERHPRDGYTPFDKFLSGEILDWYSRRDSEIFTKSIHQVVPRDEKKGMVVIDCSELGDVVVLSGAHYVVGREKTAERMNEDGTPPEMEEFGTQSFVYPFGMTSSDEPDPEQEIRDWFEDFDAYYKEQTKSFYSLNGFTYERIWTYRRLYNIGGANEFDTVNKGDLSMQNWYPGNDYPYGSLLKDSAGAAAEVKEEWFGAVLPEHLAAAEKHAVGWYFFMKENRTTDWDTRYARGNDDLNMMGTRHGLSMFPYIRETRRIVGLENFRLIGSTLFNVDVPEYDGGTSFRFHDSVGIGAYAIDVHPVNDSKGITPTFEKAAPFYIPYRALGSANVRNLIAGGKLIAGTYITNAAYRLHPIEWAIGSAGGAAAVMMHREDATNIDLLAKDRLRSLQEQVRRNSPIHWEAFDEAPTTSVPYDLVVNDFKPVINGTAEVEIYTHEGRRAEVLLDGKQIGETTTRRNGRLVLTIHDVPTGAKNFSARVYDGEGNQVK